MVSMTDPNHGDHVADPASPSVSSLSVCNKAFSVVWPAIDLTNITINIFPLLYLYKWSDYIERRWGLFTLIEDLSIQKYV